MSDNPKPDLKLVAQHETSDAEAGPVVKFLVFLGVFSILVAGLMVVMYQQLEKREAREKAPRYPMSLARDARPLPPAPRLQTYPFQDVKNFREEERAQLDTYAWVDKDAGVVRIPIERAMDVIAAKGLPHRAAPPAATPAGPAGQPPAAATPAQPAGQPPPAHGPGH